MATWRKEVHAARYRQDKKEATGLGNCRRTQKRRVLQKGTLWPSRPVEIIIVDARPTKTCVAPVDTSRDFYVFIPE